MHPGEFLPDQSLRGIGLIHQPQQVPSICRLAVSGTRRNDRGNGRRRGVRPAVDRDRIVARRAAEIACNIRDFGVEIVRALS